MQLSIDLIKTNFLVLFGLLILNEIILLVFIMTTQYLTFSKSIESMKSFSYDNQKEVANTFHQTLQREFYKMSADLDMFNNNAKIIQKTNQATSNIRSPFLNKNSEFYKSYEYNCLEFGETFDTSSTSVYQNYINTDAIQSNQFDIIGYLEKHKIFNKMNKEEYISSLIKESGLNQMTYLLYNQTQIDQEIKNSLCYFMPLMKSMIIRSLVMDSIPPIFLFGFKNVSVAYPPLIMRGANYQIKLERQFAMALGYTYNNGNGLQLQVCYKVLLSSNEYLDYCMYFGIKIIGLEKDYLNHYIDYGMIDIRQISNKTFDTFLILSFEKNKIIQDTFVSEIFNNYTLPKTERKRFQLFHMLYYHLFQTITTPSQEFMTSIFEEYQKTERIIFKRIQDHKDEMDKTKIFDGNPIYLNITQTYTQYFYNQQGQHDHTQSVFTDIFNFVFIPIRMIITIEGRSSVVLIGYSIVIGRNEISKKGEELIHLNGILAITYFQNAFAIIVFIQLLLLIMFDKIITYLMSPIVKYLNDLLTLLQETKNIRLNSATYTNLNDNQRKITDWDYNSTIVNYVNQETYQIESVVLFLRRIALLKLKVPLEYKHKILLYEENLHHFYPLSIDTCICHLNTAINCYKAKDYFKAIGILQILKDQLNLQIAKIILQDDHEIITANISIKREWYINDYSSHSQLFPVSIKRLIKLKLLLQETFYFLGFFQYIALKETTSLESIQHFTNAYDLNHHMKTNYVKNIFILILKSKCEYQQKEYIRAIDQIQESYVQLINFNTFIKDSFPIMDKSIMNLVNNLLLHIIFYYLGIYLIKSGMKKFGCQILLQSIEISMLNSQHIFCNSLKMISKCLTNKTPNAQKLLDNIYKRHYQDELITNKRPNSLIIITSINFLRSYHYYEELKDALYKYSNKYFDSNNDKLGLIESGSDCSIINLMNKHCFWEQFNKLHENHNNDINKEYVNEQNQDSSKDNTLYYDIKQAIELFQRNSISTTKTIFIFEYSNNIDFTEKKNYKQLRKNMSDNNIALYIFYFDKIIKQQRLNEIIYFLKHDNVIEGILFQVMSFKIIKYAFQNINAIYKNKQKVLLNHKLNNNIW